MVNLFHLKNIWDKIYFHPLFYFIVIISLITAHFRNLFYFTLIIFIHELGHSCMGLLLGIKLNRIEIYPYGGLSKLEYKINIKLLKELLVLISGPMIQLIFTYLVYYFKLDVEDYFFSYSKFILIFNLLPIYPLDGGRIVNIFLACFISYYNSLKYTYYISYFVFMFLFFYIIILSKNLFFILIIISLGLELFKEIKKRNNYFHKFLLERYLYYFRFRKIKYVTNIYKFRRDYLHIIGIKTEKEYLAKYFQ